MDESPRGIDGRKSAITNATKTPTIDTTQSAWRHGMMVMRSEIAAGSADFPKSPEKL
jgi:hypothetical protein